MSILDRKPGKYSTSDLFWVPNPAPTGGVVGDITPLRLSPDVVQFAQDVLFDNTGVIHSRGGFSGKTLLAAGNTKMNYLAGTVISPTNVNTNSVFALVFNDATSNKLSIFASGSGASVSSLTPTTAASLMGMPTYSYTPLQTLASGTTNQAHYVDVCNLADNSGAIFSSGVSYNSLPGNSFLNTMPNIWYGNLNTTVVNTGTFSTTVGTKTVTGVGTAWTSALVNSFLFSASGGATTGIYLGRVVSVTSATVLVLEKGARHTVAALTPNFTATMPVLINHYKGRITTSTTSTTVAGAGSKWKSNPIGATTDHLVGGLVFRYRDGAYIGTIGSVSNDTTLTLNANAAIALTNDEYFIRNSYELAISAFWQAAGFEYYAGRYWCAGPAQVTANANPFVLYPSQGSYANSLLFSKKNDPSCWDYDEVNGDVLTLPATEGVDQIRAVKATRTGMLVMRGNDTFILTGYSPETFYIRKVLDDGCLNVMSVKKYKDGVIWAGWRGVYYFDGTRIINLLSQKVLTWYQKVVIGSDRDYGGSGIANMRAGSAMVKDYYLLSWTNASTAPLWPTGNTSAAAAASTMAINMGNGSITFFTNMRVANSVDITGTASVTSPTVILCHPHPSTYGFAGTARAVLGEPLFDDSTTLSDNYDNIVITDLTTAQTGPANGGPVPMLHSANLTVGDATRLKFWKMLVFEYLSNIGMSISVFGQPSDSSGWPPQGSGTVTTTALPTGTTTVLLKRIKFLLRSPTMSVRIYPTAAASAATSQRFKLFWWKVGGKAMRQGRV